MHLISALVMSLLVFVAGSCAWAVEPEVGSYADEVLKDDPTSFFLLDDIDLPDGAAVREGVVLRSVLLAKTRGPDAVAGKGVALVAGPRGVSRRAADFGGASLLEIPQHEVFNSKDISVEFWFRSMQPFNQKYWPASATLISKATAGQGSSDWTILGGSLNAGVDEGRILVGVGPRGREDVILASGTGLNDGHFHHVVWTRTEAGQSVLYVDGKACATDQDGGQAISNSRPIQVGGETREPGAFLTGQIAAIAIYSRVLSEDRVQSHFVLGASDPRLPPAAKQPVDFLRDIKPIFQQRCFECHGPGKDSGGFSLASRSVALDGGDSGRAIVPRKSVVSPLIRLVAGLDEDNVMPPEGPRLSAEQVGLIRAWIDQGAVWPVSADEVDPRVVKSTRHWSFQALKQPAIPLLGGAMDDGDLVHDTPPSTGAKRPAADRGCPDNKSSASSIQSPIDAFILEKLPAKQLNLTRPAARHSLLRRVTFDLTGLPPTLDEIDSFATDHRPDAFAAVVERLLASRAYGERWARHWLDVVRYADSGGYETDIFYEQAWRYRDYVIRSFNDDKPYDRFLEEQIAGDELWPEHVEAMQDATAVWTLGEWPNGLDKFPELLEYARRTDQVTTFGEAILGLTVGCSNCHNHKFDPISQRDYFGLEAIFAASETWDRNTKKRQWNSGERSHFRILRHAQTPTPIRFLTRGELSKPRGLVSPALPAFFSGGGPLPMGPDESSQRRAQLARWVTSPQNPLTARVIANRVWQWHFGQALALTPNDLGTQGLAPSHPALLDWLASELIRNNWSLKQLHRTIVMSATYQQSSVREPQAIKADPQDIWLAGFPRRRMAAEEVWDHLHATSGTLDSQSFGAPFVPRLSAEELRGIYDIEQKPDKKWPVTADQNRRAIYILNRRSFRFPFFEAFDPPSTSASCPVRQSTTVPAQALTLLNNSMVGEQARAFAERLVREAGDDSAAQVRLAWLLAFSRPATDDEIGAAVRFIAESESVHKNRGTVTTRTNALIEFCLGLVNTAEFIDSN